MSVHAAVLVQAAVPRSVICASSTSPNVACTAVEPYNASCFCRVVTPSCKAPLQGAKHRESAAELAAAPVLALLLAFWCQPWDNLQWLAARTPAPQQFPQRQMR
jgi:hypothetical protein